MNKVDCKLIRESMLKEAEEYTSNHVLKLAIIYDSNSFASAKYVCNKIKTCEMLGIKCFTFEITETTSLEDLRLLIDTLNATDAIDGIILQLPLPEPLQEHTQSLIDRIDWYKDVDGLTSTNIKKLWTDEDGIRPATAEAVMRLLPDDLSGKVVTLFGRSNLVGKPLIKMLLDRNASVHVCHSKSGNDITNHELTMSDIVISAIGKPECFEIDGYSCCELFIDVGINKGADGNLCGDFKIPDGEDSNAFYTPVPGGVGILTTAQIPLNLIKCRKMHPDRLQRGINHAN